MEKGEEIPFQFAQIVFLFHLNTRTDDRKSKEFTFVRYSEINPSVDNLNCLIDCLCLRMVTDDGAVQSVYQIISEESAITASGWYEVGPFLTVVLEHHIVKSNYISSLFTAKNAWSLYRSYLTWFYLPRIKHLLHFNVLCAMTAANYGLRSCNDRRTVHNVKKGILFATRSIYVTKANCYENLTGAPIVETILVRVGFSFNHVINIWPLKKA